MKTIIHVNQHEIKANSTAKERYELALCRFYSVIKKHGEKIKEIKIEINNKTW